MMFPKSTTSKNSAYLAFVRTLPCVVCGGSSEAHHLIGHGESMMGGKSSDYFAIPLCSEHHRELHDHGWQTWESLHGNQFEHSARTLERWAKEER